MHYIQNCVTLNTIVRQLCCIVLCDANGGSLQKLDFSTTVKKLIWVVNLRSILLRTCK